MHQSVLIHERLDKRSIRTNPGMTDEMLSIENSVTRAETGMIHAMVKALSLNEQAADNELSKNLTRHLNPQSSL